MTARNGLSNRNIRAGKLGTIKLTCTVLLCLLIAACHNEMEKIDFFEQKDFPLQSMKSVRVVRSNNGNTQMIMETDTIFMVEKPKKMTVYPNGVDMHIFEGLNKRIADIKVDSAVSFDADNRIEAYKNIVIVDYRSGDTTYMKHLVWNSAAHHVYSDSIVKSVNGQRITYGDGFESDEDFKQPLIKKQRGTLTIED